MLDVTFLPTLNAFLNATATVLLVAGYRAIRRRDVETHRAFMVAALVTSALFLASYLVYHYNVGSRPYAGTGPLRAFYFFVLLTHVVLAVVNLPMVMATIARALRGQFDRHRAIARWTLPLWLYVSVTGVVVYLMLYHR
jgi:putative membrane protein